MTNIYLTDSDEEAIVDFVKDHKARKKCLWERFTNSHKLSVNVCKTWFKFQRTHSSKLMEFKSGQAPKAITERQNWIQDKFNFLKTHIRLKRLSKSSGFKSLAQGTSAHGNSTGSIDTVSMKISM